MKVSNRLSMAIGMIVLLIVSNIAMANSVISYFSTNSENWSVSGDISKIHWISSEGILPGSLQSSDNNIGDSWYFIAPAKFLGNHLSEYGQTLSYNIKVSDCDKELATIDPDIAFISNGVTMAIYGALVPIPITWSSFSITLKENAGWMINNLPATQTQIKNVLSNITSLRIKGEFKSGDDNAYLDNVALGQLPEPASMSALIVGISGMALCVIRRKRQ